MFPQNKIESYYYLFLENSQKLSEFSNHYDIPIGLFAIFFNGDEFPLKGADLYLKSFPILHLNKTLKNGIKRDFIKDITDIPVLRRYLGAILKKQLDLIAIPNKDPKYYNQNRNSYYEFEQAGEDRLSKWMKTYLNISFIELEYSEEIIEEIKNQMIQEYKPLLNFEKSNSNLLFKSEIDNLRKKCIEEAKMYLYRNIK